MVACLLTPGPGGQPTKALRTFGTMTEDRLGLADWLAAAGGTHVALEATGVYWQPIWNLLADRFSLLLANARHLKAVPGRKTDVRDCEWIADLLQHGLLQGSVVPARPQRELRELTRYRTSLVEERGAEVNRLQKTLEGANIKLAAVATDTLGKAGREMLEALVTGETPPAVLAQLAKGRMRGTLPELEQALTGRFGAHQRFLVARQLAHLDSLDALIAEVSAEITARLRVADDVATAAAPVDAASGGPAEGPPPRPFEDAVARLDTIPGVGQRIAEILVAERGPTSSASPRPGTAPRGRGCARGTTRAPASARAGGAGRGTGRCGGRWWRRPRPRGGPNGPIWAPKSAASPHVGARRKRRSPSATLSA